MTPKRRKALGYADHVRPRAPRKLALPDAPERLTWYALTTQAQSEKLAVSLLAEKGFDAFCPVERVTVRRNRRQKHTRVEVKRPMLTSMVLAGFDGPVPWLHVFATSRVTGVVGIGGVPARIGVAAVLSLLSRSGIEGVQREPLVMAGDQVRVGVGPFEGFEGHVVECTDGKARVRLRLDGVLADCVHKPELDFDEADLMRRAG